MKDTLKILLVDDDALDRTAARRALKEAQITAEMVEVDSIAAAKTQLHTGGFDCVLLDYQLPDGDGLTLLDHLHNENNPTPVIVLTGHGDEVIAVALMKAGAADYLAKSRLTPATLARALHSVMRVQQAERQAKQTELALRESEERFRVMADSAPVLLWVSDESAQCIFFNRSWLDFTGRDMADEIGEGWQADIHPDDLDSCTETFQTAVKLRRRYQSEFRLRSRLGDYRWMLNQGAPRFTPEGGFVGYIGSCLDITERKQTEDTLRENQNHIAALNDKLRHSMQETHDRVRNSLQIIASMIDMQTMEGNATIAVAEVKHLGHSIHMLSLVHDILMQQARRDGEANSLSAEELLEKLLSALQQIAGNRAIRAEISDVMLTAQQGSAIALITNELVSNALKYGEGVMLLKFHANSSHALLDLFDEGPGFPPGFDPRREMHNGLELVERLSRWNLRGETCYGNLPGGGAHVCVTFPLLPYK